MVSKNQIKLITQLHQKKYRTQHKLFIAEGSKLIKELLPSRFVLHRLFTTVADIFEAEPALVEVITEKELYKISRLSTPNKALALFKIPGEEPVQPPSFTVTLDKVSDPGNLGTIIRLCDWFGVSCMVCSRDTADCYNPKAVQASMGSLARVQVVYTGLEEFLSGVSLPVIAADVKGRNVYTATLPEKAVLVMGNEANGISETVLKKAAERISIPNFSVLQQAESLNVATAAAVLLSEFRRRKEYTSYEF